MWRRKRRKRGKIVFGCLILLLIGFVYGYVTNDAKMPKDMNKENINDIRLGEIDVDPQKDTQNQNNSKKIQSSPKEENIDDVNPIVEDINVVTDDIQIVFNTHYKSTGDIVKKEIKLPKEWVGRNFDELKTYLKENYVEWNIRECTKNSVELYQVTDKNPPNCYILKEQNGYIGIFQVNEVGENVLLEQTEIPMSSLSDADLEYIKKGIILKKREEVNQRLEDYSS